MQPIFWGILVVAVVLLVVFYLRFRGAKEAAASATVVEKHIEEYRSRSHDDDSLPSSFVVTFQVGKRSVCLMVNRSTYDRVQPGSQGTLRHKGDVFIEFEPSDPYTFH